MRVFKFFFFNKWLFILGVDFIKVFRTSFQTVQQLYGQIGHTIQKGADNFYQNGINPTTFTINSTVLSNLVINTNQQISSLYQQIGIAFAGAKTILQNSS